MAARIRLATRTERPEIERAGSDREKNHSGKDRVFPNSVRHKRYGLSVVGACSYFSTHPESAGSNSARHRPPNNTPSFRTNRTCSPTKSR